MAEDKHEDIARQANLIARLDRAWPETAGILAELREMLAQPVAGHEGDFALFSIPE